MNRFTGIRFWVEITFAGGFSTTVQKKPDSQGRSSFVENFDAYLESKGTAQLQRCAPKPRVLAAGYYRNAMFNAPLQPGNPPLPPSKNPRFPSAASLNPQAFLNSPAES